MYRAKTLIAHPLYSAPMGATITGMKPALVKQFLADGIIEQIGAPDEAMPGFEDAFEDVLTPMSRDELKATMKVNNLHTVIKIYNSWSDEQIREAIRSVTEDMATLLMPPAVTA